MKIEKLPTKLSTEPLVDALCEMRFTPTTPASSILPGLLFKELGGGQNFRVSALPASQIPPEVRQVDPMLQFAPLMRLLGQGFAIGIGDSVVTVSIHGKYPGWSEFKPAIMKVFEATIGSGIVNNINRYSLKYVDVIPFDFNQPKGGLDLNLSVGLHYLKTEAAHIRMEVLDNPYIHIIQAITNAEAVLTTGEKRGGSLIDVDTISMEFDSTLDGFVNNLPKNLDEAHSKNKREFFECLTEETLKNLGPVYE